MASHVYDLLSSDEHKQSVLEKIIHLYGTSKDDVSKTTQSQDNGTTPVD